MSIPVLLRTCFDFRRGQAAGNRGRERAIAFVDAIHTGDFVRSQVELLVARLAPGGLILLDDINFSADMADCRNRLAADPLVAASAAIGGRVGLLEFP